MRPAEKVLERLQNVRGASGSWTALCPAHDDRRKSSLSISEGEDGRALVKCFAGCSAESVVAAVGLQMRDLFEDRNGYRRAGGSGPSGETGSTHQWSTTGCTLDEYADYVRLPREFLEGLGLEQYTRLSKAAVSMPYLDETGEEVLLKRSRVSLEGKPKVMTRKGDKHRLYGLWRLEAAHEAGYLYLVEGESDTQTLWYYGEPAAGIPGANGWKAEWVGALEGIGRVYFVVEDEAGEACWQKLAATPELQDRLYRVELDDAKDISELHRHDPDRFAGRLGEARGKARAWLDIAETEAQERSRKAWAGCSELAESPDILEEFARDLELSGVAGERKNGKLLYLALTSRLLKKPISVAVKGPSSGGKSYLVKQVMGFFPDQAYWFFSGMSERTLFYTEEPLSHRHIILAEAAGMGGDFQDYVIRTLLSEGFLEYEFIEKTAEGLQPRRLRKDGPTGFITTTTRHSLHAENETRYLSLTVTDTRAQTRAVFKTLAAEGSNGEDDGPDPGRWHALQEWVEGTPRGVSVPYAGVLAERMADVAVRLRRDFSVLLSLIKTHAILHQAGRERDSTGRIVASLEDYARVRELVAELVAEGVEATVPPVVREAVEAVGRLVEKTDSEHATNREVAEELRVDKAAVSRRVRAALERGYLKNLEDRRGRPARLVVGEPMPEDTAILPDPDDLDYEDTGEDRGTVDVLTPYSGGIEYPSPPRESPDGEAPSENPDGTGEGDRCTVDGVGRGGITSPSPAADDATSSSTTSSVEGPAYNITLPRCG